MGQPALAFLAAVKAFAAGVDRAGVREDLERLAPDAGDFETLADLYEAAAGEAPQGSPEALSLLRRAAELRDKLGQTDEAVRLWKSVQDASPLDRQALEAMTCECYAVIHRTYERLLPAS